MFKRLCLLLPAVVTLAVATPATLSERCDDPSAHPSPLTQPLLDLPPSDSVPIDLQPIILEPFTVPSESQPLDQEAPGLPGFLPLEVKPSPVPMDFESPALDSTPKIPGLNDTTNHDDGRNARKEFSNSFKRKNVVYFTDWSIYNAGFLPKHIPADDVTHLLYAFAGIAQDGSVYPFDIWADEQKSLETRDSGDDEVHGAVEQVFLLKQKHRHMKTLLSVGGWTASQDGKFGPAIGSAGGRRRFAQTAVKLLADWGFDGIDIDYEYPATPEEAENFVYLLQECRQALDEYASRNGQEYHYLLTVATGAGPEHYNLLDMEAMDQYLDTWHLMAYDYAGSWDKVSGQQSNVYLDWENPESTMFNTDQAVDDYIARGIDTRKIVLGIPLYGRSFMNTDGLGKPYSGMGKGSIEPGIWLYRDLPRPGSTVYINKYTISAYSYDPSTRELISFDNTVTAALKAEYLQSRGLGGAVFWEASGDQTGDDSLITTVAREMGYLDDSINMLEFPESRFSNIRNAS